MFRRFVARIQIWWRRAYIWLLRRRARGVHYIVSGDTLPPPLSPIAESEYIEKMEQGDKHAKEVLIERNLRLVIYIAKKFDNTSVPMDDLISIGSIGLIKAVNSYKSGKNIKLATFASKCIENEILMFLRKTVRTKVEISLDEPLNTDSDGNELQLTDVLGMYEYSVYDVTEKGAMNECLYKALGKLKSRERMIVEMRFGLNNSEERTQKEVAELLGISQSYISRLEKKIMKKLKNDITQAG